MSGNPTRSAAHLDRAALGASVPCVRALLDVLTQARSELQYCAGTFDGMGGSGPAHGRRIGKVVAQIDALIGAPVSRFDRAAAGGEQTP